MTVNPALFRELAQGLGLDAIVDAIVVSGEERTIDKGVLCQIALERMRIDCPSERALLIDNRRENLDAWAGRGGSGYLYTTDAAFRRDVAKGVDGLLDLA